MMLARAFLLIGALLAVRAEAGEPPLVVTAAERVPLAYVENGRPTGLFVDLAREAFRRAGRAVEFRLMPWPRCLAETRSGKADAILTMFRTPEREAQFVFTGEAVLQQTESLFVKKDDALRYDGDLSVLSGKRIGVVYQTSYGPRIDRALTDGLFAEVETQGTMIDLVKMLVHGRIDVVPGDRNRVIGAAGSAGLADEIRELQPAVDVMPGYLAFTRKRDLTALGRAFDQALRAMKSDGAYAAILARYPYS
jgi:polar amino acid transport system substrate-binding protein